MNSRGKTNQNPPQKSRLLAQIDRCALNMGSLVIFECFYFFVGYFAVFRLSKIVFFDVVSLRGFTIAQAGDMFVLLSDSFCLIAAIVMMVFFSFYIAVECAAVILACNASRRGERLSVSDLFKLSMLKALKLFFPVNWPFLIHGIILIPVFHFGFVFKAVTDWEILTPVLHMPYWPLFIAAVLFCVLTIGAWCVYAFHFFVLNDDAYLTAVQKSVIMVRGKLIQTELYLILSMLAPYLLAALTIAPFVIVFYNLSGFEVLNAVFERAAVADLNAFFGDHQNRTAVLSMVLAALGSAMMTTVLSLINAPMTMVAVDAAFYQNGGKRLVKRIRIRTKKRFRSRKKTSNPTGYYAVIGLLLAVFVSYQAYGLLNLMFWGSTNAVGRLMVAAHRGDSAQAPENTKAAILKAIDDGADYVEVDVTATKDGVLILCHDLNLKRFCGINKKIADMTYDELKNLDIGSHYNRAFAKERFLTLDEAMTLCDGKIKMNIELKPSGRDDHLAEKAVDIFHNHFFYQKGFISSLNKKTLIRVETLDPLITTCLDTFAPADKTRLCEADIYSVQAKYLTDELLNNLEKNGKQCWAWTVNNEDKMSELIDKGITGIVTDRPNQALTLAKTRQVTDANFMRQAYWRSLFHIY